MVLGGAARNRMLIKGGSSFNALVRALKQDVVTGAAPTTTANEKLMYEVDKVLNFPALSVRMCIAGRGFPGSCKYSDRLTYFIACI